MKMYEVTLIVLIDTTKREKPLSVPDERRVSGQWPDKEGFLIKQMTYKY